MGITPNIIVLRCDEPIKDSGIFHKVAGFCNVKLDCVIENLTLPILYEAPLYLEEQGLSSVVCRELHLPVPEPDLREWRAMVSAIKNRSKSVTIGLVGKYVQLHDAYLSVAEARCATRAFFLDAKVSIRWIDSELVTAETVESTLAGLDGILVPGGFGSRGIEGMILAAQYAREKRTSLFRHLPGHAGGSDRISPPCAGHRRCQLRRVCSGGGCTRLSIICPAKVMR